MRLRYYILILALVTGGLFAERPVIELLEPQSLSPTEYGPIEYVDDSGYVVIRKWDSCNCTSDIFQTIQLRIRDADGIDWTTLQVEVLTFGGAINTVWWDSHPFYYFLPGSLDVTIDSVAVEELIWASQQDYSIEIDSSGSDTIGYVTVTPLGRGIRPAFFCHDSCNFGAHYFGPCCINIGDVISPGFGHTAAPLWEFPTHISIGIMDLVGDGTSQGFYFCVDYSGPSASTPRPADGAMVDTLHPIIGITILDTIWVRHSAYPNPIDPYFPHCPCYDSLCTDSTGAPLEFPYCGDKFIEWNTVDTASIRLSVNGAVYSLDSPGMSWFDDSLLLFDTGEAGLSFSDGDTVRVCLEEATDRVSQGHGPNHLGRHADWTHPDTPVPFCWEFYVNTVGIEETGLPRYSGITSVHPNPFNSGLNIKYSLAEKSRVQINVYDILGRVIANIIDETDQIGDYEIYWDASEKPGGIYFIRAKIGDESITKRVVYLK